MDGKNYYVILDVSRTESTAGIRARYRDLERTRPADVAGPKRAGAFREVTEAYSVLADPVARRRHNDELTMSDEPRVGRWPEPIGPWRWEPVSMLAAPDAVRPSFDALVERLFRNFTGLGVPKSERPEGLTFELILTPDEAMRGGEASFGIPSLEWCRECGGRGHVWSMPCSSCAGQGTVVAERTVRVRIPPFVRPGSLLEAPLLGIGIRNLYLRLHVRVE